MNTMTSHSHVRWSLNDLQSLMYHVRAYTQRLIVPASSGVASYGALGHVPPPPSTSNNFIFSSL